MSWSLGEDGERSNAGLIFTRASPDTGRWDRPAGSGGGRRCCLAARIRTDVSAFRRGARRRALRAYSCTRVQPYTGSLTGRYYSCTVDLPVYTSTAVALYCRSTCSCTAVVPRYRYSYILLYCNTPVQANTPVLTVKLPACLAVAHDARADLVGTSGDLAASRSSPQSSSGTFATRSCAARGAREEGPRRHFQAQALR